MSPHWGAGLLWPPARTRGSGGGRPLPGCRDPGTPLVPRGLHGVGRLGRGWSTGQSPLDPPQIRTPPRGCSGPLDSRGRHGDTVKPPSGSLTRPFAPQAGGPGSLGRGGISCLCSASPCPSGEDPFGQGLSPVWVLTCGWGSTQAPGAQTRPAHVTVSRVPPPKPSTLLPWAPLI